MSYQLITLTEPDVPQTFQAPLIGGVPAGFALLDAVDDKTLKLSWSTEAEGLVGITNQATLFPYKVLDAKGNPYLSPLAVSVVRAGESPCCVAPGETVQTVVDQHFIVVSRIKTASLQDVVDAINNTSAAEQALLGDAITKLGAIEGNTAQATQQLQTINANLNAIKTSIDAGNTISAQQLAELQAMKASLVEIDANTDELEALLTQLIAQGQASIITPIGVNKAGTYTIPAGRKFVAVVNRADTDMTVAGGALPFGGSIEFNADNGTLGAIACNGTAYTVWEA